MSRKIAKIVSGLTTIVLLQGCPLDQSLRGGMGGYDSPYTGQMTSAEMIGGVLGAAAGAYGGSQIGGGNTRIVTGLVGAAAGAWLGKSLAGYLTQSSQEQMANATYQAAQSGQTQAWQDPASGTHGQAEVLGTSTAPQIAGTGNGGSCKAIRQTVTLQDGTQRDETVRVCQGANGWQVM